MATVIVTGANSGLGLQTSLAFARSGDSVIACVRNLRKTDKLTHIALSEKLDIQVHKLDVTQPDSFSNFLEYINSNHQSIDVLVNNAGIIRAGSFEYLDERALREVMETNFFGAMLLTQRVLPQMRKRGKGKIIMISSLSGIAGLAGDVAYSASKFALEGACEALRHEVSRFGIDVALVEAAQYATGLFGKADNERVLTAGNQFEDSVYKPLVEARHEAIRKSLGGSNAGRSFGQLIVDIARSDGSQLRWQADDFSRGIVSTIFGLSDSERDAFLRNAAQIDWWIEGKNHPNED